jgi:hypothetical protein
MFKKTLPPCRTRNARPVFNRQTHNAPNNALKHRNQEGDHRRRNRIEDESQKPVYVTTATSRQHHHQRHRPLHDPEDALRSRDLTSAAVQPRSPSLHFRRDTHGVARSWRHYRNGHAMSHHSLMKKKKKTRVKKRKTKKGLPRGGITIRVGTVATVVHHEVRRERQISTIAPMKLLAVATATPAYATPPSTPRPRLTRATEERPKYYNSEFRKRDTQRHRSSLDLSPWPSFPSNV